MLRRCAWLQWILTAYVWLMVAAPLGQWNLRGGTYLLPGLLHGHWPSDRDVAVTALVAVPALMFWAAYKRRGFILASIALAMDAAWLGVEIKIWWIPYAFGEGYGWQRVYAQWPTTRILPSFVGHFAPDGMHTVTGVLLLVVLCTGITALLGLRLARRRATI